MIVRSISTKMRMQVCGWAVLIALAGGVLSAQGCRKVPSSSDGATQVPLLYTVSTSALLTHGFSFSKIPRAMCPISGPDGPCQVEAFVAGEKKDDPASYTCRKLDRATYLGHCINGNLEGLSVLLAEGSAKDTGEWVFTYFDKGRLAFPALMAFRDGELIGIREEQMIYGCVGFGHWDRSATLNSCPKFIEIWGSKIFSESTLQSLKKGTFDLNRYGPSFVKYISAQ
jgi:hypothetical protein